MIRRRQRQRIDPKQNLDSFLDILTNTVGVLMFIGLFVALVSAEAGTIIRTPLVSTSRKQPVFFETRNNQVLYIDHQEVDRQLERLYASLPECREPNFPESYNSYLYEYYLDQIQTYNACLTDKVQQLETFSVSTDNYIVSFSSLNALRYEPIETVPGETGTELTQKNSDFNTVLNQIDPSTNYLVFIVRPDSFPAYRQARQQAWKRGFDVGWEPFTEETPIVFGSGGRAVGVQ